MIRGKCFLGPVPILCPENNHNCIISSLFIIAVVKGDASHKLKVEIQGQCLLTI